MGGMVYKQQVTHVSNPVRAPHPISVAVASALGRLMGRDINGTSNGAIRYGWPAVGTRSKYAGYALPEQAFIGWNPGRVAGGAVRNAAGGLPGTQAPVGYQSPLLDALAGTVRQ